MLNKLMNPGNESKMSKKKDVKRKGVHYENRNKKSLKSTTITIITHSLHFSSQTSIYFVVKILIIQYAIVIYLTCLS